MVNRKNTAPASAPSLFNIHSALTNALAEHRDTPIGEPVTEEMAEDLRAAPGQIRLTMERIQRFADTID